MPNPPAARHPDATGLIPPDHRTAAGPTAGWAATDFTAEHYTGDDYTSALPPVADGTQVDAPPVPAVRFEQAATPHTNAGADAQQ